MKNYFYLFILYSILLSCSTSDLCKRYDSFYLKKYNIKSNCSGSSQGIGREKIFKTYRKDLKNIDSSLIVIEQLYYSLGTDFYGMEVVFIKDGVFDAQFKYMLKRDKFSLKDTSKDYAQIFGKPNYTTVNIILEKIKTDGLKGVDDLVLENNGGVEGNTKITVYNKNMEIIDAIRLKRQLRFTEELPPIPKITQ